jgi:maleate isomerase
VVQAALGDIRRANVKSLLLATPYVADVTARLRSTFQEAGLPVIGAEGLGLDDDLDIGAVLPQEIKDFVTQAVQRVETLPDSVFLSCTTFRAFEIAEELESELDIPVFTSNRSAYHAILRHLEGEA